MSIRLPGEEIITRYFPGLSSEQHGQFARLGPLYREWNEKINVISRKDIGHLYLHHVLHSLGIAKVVSFVPGTMVLDVGTGGGFPGIPLAILLPSVQFTLVDSISKKIRVVEAVVQALQLKNVTARQTRAEEMKEQFDFVVSRAVTALPEFYSLVSKRIRPGNKNTLPNGILYLKGGDIEEEIKPVKSPVKVFELSGFFKEPFFETKKLVWVGKQTHVYE